VRPAERAAVPSDRVRARLTELLDHYGVDQATAGPLEALLDALNGDPSAPTSVREPERAIDVHIADSLSGLEVPELRAATRIADVGSGAGLPGLVLAAVLPAARVTLVESAKRKCEFLARTVERMGLTGTTDAAGAAAVVRVEIVPLRAEEWRAGLECCDAVTVRAVASLPVLCEYASPLLAPDGMLVCWKGRVAAAEAADGAAAAAMLGLSEPEILRVKPYAEARDHALWTFRKVAPTPPGYPRRAGMAAKRALSATIVRHDTR
jgi:16S rRNA (guanine527-N7)-methyltransferase